MIRVLVVDDQALVRSGFRMILEAEPGIEVVGEAADGKEAVDHHRALRPDVVVMDVRMPLMDGVEATRRINEHQGHRARILIVTTFDLDDYVHRALGAGASGFLLKDAPPEQLVDAVRVIAAGEALLAPSITRRLIEQFATERRRLRPDDAVQQLTDREQEVLGHLARGRSNAEIASNLTVSETTVKTHVGHVLSKLNLRDRVQAVVWAYEHGVVRPGD